MKPEQKPMTELDMMLLRGGWQSTPSDWQFPASRTRVTEFSCAACAWMSKALYRAGKWFEARAQRSVTDY